MTQEQEILLLDKLKEEHCEYYHPYGDSSKEKIHDKDCQICANRYAIDDIAEKFAQHKCAELMAELGSIEKEHTLELNKLRMLHDERMDQKNKRIAEQDSLISDLTEALKKVLGAYNPPFAFRKHHHAARELLERIENQTTQRK